MSLFTNTAYVFSLFGAAPTPDAVQVPWYANSVSVFFIMGTGVLILSFLLGGYLSRLLRMPDYGWKLSVILVALLGSIAILYRGWPPKLGVDLGGGAILIYRVDTQKSPVFDMQGLVTAISKRVNPGGQKEISVRPLGSDMVQITMPTIAAGETDETKRQAESDQIKNIIRQTGSLEFRIVADYLHERSKIEQALADPNSRELKSSDGQVLARWVPVKDSERGILADKNLATRMRGEHLEALVLIDPYNVTGKLLRHAEPSTDTTNGQPAVAFTFDSEGAYLFGRLTGDHLPEENFQYHLAIILDDELESAPVIRSQISDRGQITGRFTQKEVEGLVAVLNAGSLPATLIERPEGDLVTGPTLGSDTIEKSRLAMIISSILVPLFMLWYYRFSGMVANLALALNMLMLIAIMVLIKAPFTLSALAGLALTVGMAVDNNVLIYERLREELHHGAALRMAIRNAFHRAGVVIIDANCTHLIAATVLFVEGTEQIRGFAVTFWLGAVLSIWATMFVARVMFEIAERKQWLTQAKMMHVLGHTNIDFMGWFPAAATFSVLITVVGLAVALHRGYQAGNLLDIDFTGGVSVQALFKEADQDVRQVREKVAKLSDDVTVSDIQVGDDPRGKRFLIDTSIQSREEVEKYLQDKFSGQLETNDLKVGKLTTITAAAPTPKSPEKPPAEKPPAEKPAVKPTPPPEKPATKPETKPEAKPAEKPEAKTVEKPAEKPTAGVEERPSDQPKDDVDERPVEPPKDDPAAPAPKAQSRRADLPPDNMVAMAGPAPVLVALADAPKPAAKAEKPAEKPVEKPAEKPAAKPAEKPAEKPAPKPAQSEPTAATPAETPVDPLAGGTQVDLDLKYKLDHDTVVKLIKDALAANGLSDDTRLDVSARSEKYHERDSTSYEQWLLKIKLSPDKTQQVLSTVQKQLQQMPYFPYVMKIGGAVARDTRYYAVIALVASWSLIILYLWIRFQGVAFGLAAVIALIHDVLVMLGAIAFSYYVPAWLGAATMIDPFKINLQIVAAFLTIIGYSVNDTIVVFDRIREVRGKDPRITRQMVNDATNQTLSRTLLTSFTVMLVVVILYLFGGQAVHGFAFALIIGVLTGTYSSIYVAAPILLWLVHPKEMQQSSRSRPQEAR